MSLELPIHFNELHLLPRVVLSMGAVVFVTAVIDRDLSLALFGAGAIFWAVAYNFVVVIFRIGYEMPEQKEQTKLNENKKEDLIRKLGLALNLVVALALGIACFYLSLFFRTYNAFPLHSGVFLPPASR